MRTSKRLLCVCVTLILVMQLGWPGSIFAAVDSPQPAPEKLRVEAINDTPPNVEPAVGYDKFDKYYADLKSDSVDMPASSNAPAAVYLNYYLQEVNKPYKPVKPATLQVGSIPAVTGSGGVNEQRMKNLSSGTIYYAFSRAYYTYTLNNTTYTSPESTASNTVKFMTDIDISAYSYGPNQIKIIWDDVWNSGKRMDYKLYISENKDFSNTPPIYIGQDQIGPNQPVNANEATGKLEYIHTVRDPGRVYYIKIVPDTNEAGLEKSASSPVIVVSSYILAKTTKMSTSGTSTIWKLEWSPVVTGLGSNVDISYQIYKGSTDSGNLDQYMASSDDTVFFLTVAPEDVSSYYIIKAIVTQNGQDVYPDLDKPIQSQKIYVKESETPSVPPVPEIVDNFYNGSTKIIGYADNLKSTSATILWRVPYKGNGEIDTDTLYDIWLISDPNAIDDPPSSMMIAADIKMGDSNYVKSGNTIVGYRYDLAGLLPNTTYYFKIVAKKTYVDFVDNTLQTIVKESQPAMKVIVTPTDGRIDQPVVPGRPPLSIKKTPGGTDMVTGTSAVIQLKNAWYEEYRLLQGGGGHWVYVTPEYLRSKSVIIANIDNGSDYQNLYRKVSYDSGVTIDVGCVEYTPDIDYNHLDQLQTNKIIGVPVTPNDPDEDVTKSDGLPDGQKHNVDITINGLESNKNYIIWVRAARRSVDLISGPSDPIIVTTIPIIGVTIEKPTVPTFNYSRPADTYVDLGWDFNFAYTYHIKYSKTDDIATASDTVDVTPDDLKNSSFYRLDGLETNTLYYFWIQAEARNEAGDTSQSEWSDSLPVKTLPDIPPATPRGFGVKGTDGSVTKDSITYEWNISDGMSYKLEIAGDMDYKDTKSYTIGEDTSEYTVTGLRSNYRYFARLYAYDPDKQLYSDPTQSIIVRTLRSSDDYDSNEDIENVANGNFIEKAPTPVNHVWNITITGIDAQRFIEHVQTDSMLDYNIDLRSAPDGTDRITLLVDSDVFHAMSMLGENLVVQSDRNTLVFRPGVVETVDTGDGSDVSLQIGITLNGNTDGSNIKNLNFKTPVSGFDVGLAQGGKVKPVKQLGRPLQVVYNYTAPGWYKEGLTSGYVLGLGSTDWQKAATRGRYDAGTGMGQLTFEAAAPGRMAVIEPGKDIYDDIARNWAKNSIASVASVHKLKSVAGTSFQPDKNVTNGDAAKFMLDMLDMNYGADYMKYAVRSGLLTGADAARPNAACTREELIGMTMRLYEIKTSDKAAASSDDTHIYKDIGQVSPALLPKIRFALENGIITSRFSDTLGPKDPVTRAETMVLLEKLLKFTGEL